MRGRRARTRPTRRRPPPRARAGRRPRPPPTRRRARTAARRPSEGGGSGEFPTGQDVGCDEAEGASVGYSIPIPDPNFAAIEEVIANALGEYGAELTAVNANLDPGKQISDIQTLLQQGVDVLIANPVDPNATVPAFEQARGQDVPIVAQDTAVGGPFFTTVSADVEAAAEAGAEALAELVGEGGQVAAVYGPDFAEVLVRQREAFQAAAAEAGFELVDEQVNQTITPDGGRQIADAFKQQYGEDLAGIWTFNDTTAVGVAGSFDDSFDPALVSINGQPEAIPLVEGGAIDVTYDLQQDKIGQALAYGALAAICDREVPEQIRVPIEVVDTETVGDYRPLQERVGDPFDITLEERDGQVFTASSDG